MACDIHASPAPLSAAPRPRLAARIAAFIVAATETVIVWRLRSRQRALLATLDDRMLRDLGVSRAEAQREADKPFWEA